MSEGFKFDGRGKLVRVETFTSKAGKPFHTLIVSVEGQYPQLVPIKVFGRLADCAGDWKPGDVLEITGTLGGRDWQGKVFGDIKAESVEVISGQREEPKGNPPAGPAPGDDDVPF